ncbi:MAG: copper chaperone PCu(A)C [Sulfuriflexus sp.]|nr:copper chaperone PCu(A)C [Sulfuriflexus sp.]
MFNFKNAIAVLLITLTSPFVVAENLTIDDAWIREAPPVSRVQAAYAIFKNDQSSDIEIVSASSSAFKKIEFHKTISENGLTKMRQQASIAISAKESAVLKPEGMHMMLFNPVTPLRAGEKVDINFKLSNGNSMTSSFTVKKVSGSDHHQHMHH